LEQEDPPEQADLVVEAVNVRQPAAAEELPAEIQL
jgi:hypothetical protein